METFVTTPMAIAPSRTIRQSGMVSKQSLLRRFQHFIESTEWEERYLCHNMIDKICLGIIVISLLYFVPVLMSIFLK